MASVADLAIFQTHSGSFTQADVGDTYTLTVTNLGAAATVGTVTMTDALPAGLTATAIGGSGWTGNLGTMTCTRSDALAAGARYPPITGTGNVATNGPAGVTNTALVSGGGQTNTANDTASDPTAIIPLTPIQAWRLQWFGTTANSGVAADTYIGTSDGMENLLKYALGLNPLVATNNPVVVDISSGYLRLTSPKNPNATDVSFHVEADIRGIRVLGRGQAQVAAADVDNHRIVRGYQRIQAQRVLQQVLHAVARSNVGVRRHPAVGRRAEPLQPPGLDRCQRDDRRRIARRVIRRVGLPAARNQRRVRDARRRIRRHIHRHRDRRVTRPRRQRIRTRARHRAQVPRPTAPADRRGRQPRRQRVRHRHRSHRGRRAEVRHRERVSIPNVRLRETARVGLEDGEVCDRGHSRRNSALDCEVRRGGAANIENIPGSRRTRTTPINQTERDVGPRADVLERRDAGQGNGVERAAAAGVRRIKEGSDVRKGSRANLILQQAVGRAGRRGAVIEIADRTIRHLVAVISREAERGELVGRNRRR